MKLLIAYLLVIGVVSRFTNADDDIEAGNGYIDEVLDSIRGNTEVTSQFDPMDVPDFKENNIEMKNNKVRGISHLRRSGDCSIQHDGNVVRLEADIGADDITFETDYRTKVLFVVIKGYSELFVKDISVRLVIVGEGGKAKLESFKVTHLGEYEVRSITGMTSLYNWLLKIMANAVAKKARDQIRDAMEVGLSKAIQGFIDTKGLPIS